jgi:CheY-like chemotaxis protein
LKADVGAAPQRVQFLGTQGQMSRAILTMHNRDFQKRVLVVDDEPLILETMSAILEGEGYVVRTAEDGFAALMALRETPPDIIISDLRMPNMSGFELLAVVRRRFPHIPVIAISGEYVAVEMPAGLLVDVFLQKGGYTQKQLFEIMQRLLGEAPTRPHAAKPDKTPLWIPRRDAGYIVAVCTDCLRSFAVTDESTGAEVRETECPSCGIKVKYMVDSEILKMLDEKRKRLPQLQ